MAKKKSIGSGQTLLPDYKVSVFTGLNNSAKSLDELSSLDPGAAVDELNWVTGSSLINGKYVGDHIELRHGTAFLNGTAQAGTSKISGLTVATKKDGTQIPYFSTGRQVFYYDATLNSYVEVGTNLLPVAAASDDVSFVPYQNITSYYLGISSPNSSYYYIDLQSALGTATDTSATEYRGYLSQNQGRYLLWNRNGATSTDFTDLFMSQADTVGAPIVSAPNYVPPGSPVASSPSVFSQPGYGSMMAVMTLSGIYFCFHQYGTYQISITNNDVTQAAQQLYRQNVGILYHRSAWATGDGIIYVDTFNQSYPKFRMLTLDYSLSTTNPAIIPKSISDQIDFTANDFSNAVVYEWGNYYVLSCKGVTNGVPDTQNDFTYFYNKLTGAIDKTDYRATCFSTYSGALLAGDSIAPNPLILMSGFDDVGYNIYNYWRSAPTYLGQQGMKRFNRFVVKGLIQPSQNLDVYFAFDGGSFSKIGTILGNGQYVNLGTPIDVGGPTVGSNVVGGGGTVNAYSFECEFQVGSDIFNRVAVQFMANSVGYCEIDSYEFKDVRYKTRRVLANLSQ